MDALSAAKEWVKVNGIIEAEEFEAHPEKPGYLRLVRMRTFGEVWRRIKQAIKDHDEHLSIEYASAMDVEKKLHEEFPQEYRWCVYLVEGANEGFYIHIEIKTRSDSIPIALVKTLGDWDSGLRILSFVTVLVGLRW